MHHVVLCARLIRIVAAFALACAGSAVLSAPPAAAHPEVCQTGHDDGDHSHDEVCFRPEQIAAMDDSAADLGVGEEARSANMRRMASVPKQPEFAAEDHFNTDLAFTGKYAIAGNYQGFSIYDISRPLSPRRVSTTVCPGSQNDVSVAGNLLFTSTDTPRNKAQCDGSVEQSSDIGTSWEGIRIFDISDPAHPRYVTAVATDCGSHTHTTIPDPAHRRTLIYVQSYGPYSSFAGCQPPHDKISIVEVPDGRPQDARVIATPVLFAESSQAASATSGCHDITAYPAKGLAAGACMGVGVLLDIRDPAKPVVLDTVTDTNFAFWHSATFNNDATTVVFTDELGGGGGPTCNPTVGPNRGGDAVYRIVGNRLEFASYFKIPRVNRNTENCVAHNGSLMPAIGRDIMVQGWYQGGISVWEFTDPAHPREIAWFDRGPVDAARSVLAGSWSAYAYNGMIYSSDIQKGLDVFFVADSALMLGTVFNYRPMLNVQTQTPFPLH